MFDVHSDGYGDYELMDEILIDSRWECSVRIQCLEMLLYYFMLPKLLRKYR